MKSFAYVADFAARPCPVILHEDGHVDAAGKRKPVLAEHEVTDTVASLPIAELVQLFPREA